MQVNIAESILSIFNRYLPKDEINILIDFLNNGVITEDSISNNFGIEDAKFYSSIIWRHRNELPEENVFFDFYYITKNLNDRYSKEKSNYDDSNLIMGKNALDPVGMCDLKRIGYTYDTEY